MNFEKLDTFTYGFVVWREGSLHAIENIFVFEGGGIAFHHDGINKLTHITGFWFWLVDALHYQIIDDWPRLEAVSGTKSEEVYLSWQNDHFGRGRPSPFFLLESSHFIFPTVISNSSWIKCLFCRCGNSSNQLFIRRGLSVWSCELQIQRISIHIPDNIKSSEVFVGRVDDL